MQQPVGGHRVAAVRAVLASQQQRIVVEGQALPSDEANLAELQRLATEFASVALPILRALGIA